MSSSLDLLVKNLASGGGHKFKGFNGYNAKQRSLLVRKGVYPYKYMDGWDRFKETSLSPASRFHSKLNMLGISNEDYAHALEIWEKFNITNLGVYHDLYLRTDVILLANVFEEFRRVCMDNYGLDPVHFYTTPGLAW